MLYTIYTQNIIMRGRVLHIARIFILYHIILYRTLLYHTISDDMTIHYSAVFYIVLTMLDSVCVCVYIYINITQVLLLLQPEASAGRKSKVLCHRL